MKVTVTINRKNELVPLVWKGGHAEFDTAVIQGCLVVNEKVGPPAQPKMLTRYIVPLPDLDSVVITNDNDA